MADNDNRRKLYDNINKEYDLPDYDQFSKDMEDDTKRKRLYDAVAKEYDLPDYNKFSQDMGYGQQEVQTNNQQNVQQSAQIPQAPQTQQPLQPQQTATVDSRHAEKSYDEQKAAYDKQYAETYNKLAKEGRVRMGIENHPNVKMVAVTDDLIKKFPILEQSRGYQVPFDMNYGTPIMQNLNDKGDIITPDEAREQYTKILTNQNFDYVPQQETAAVQVGNVIKTSLDPRGGWLDNITKGSLEYAYGKDWRDKKYEIGGKEVGANDMYARTKQELYDDINTEIGNIRHSLLFAKDEQKKETVDQLYEKGYLKEDILPKGTVLHYIMNVGKDEQLEELKQRRTKAQVQKEMVMDKLKKIPQPDHGETMAEFYTRTAQDGSELYASDLRKLDKQINQYDAVIDELEGRNSSSREWGHAVKTSGITQLGAWDFGITDLKDAMLMYPLARKVENGGNITQDDYTSLKLLSQANDADAVEGALMPSSYNIKKGGLVSAPFTLQFMAGGEFAKGATTMADKAIARTVKGAIYKAAGKKVLSAAERLAEKAASNKMVSLVGMLGKDFRQAFFMENTTGAATTGAEILNRRNGTVTETGDGFDWQGETLPMAIYKGEMSQNIELQTEFLGEHFPSSLKFIRGMAHTKVGSAMGLRNMAAWLSKLSRKDLANTIRSYATKGGINGLWGEYMEEVAGTAENAIFIGDQKLSDLVDAKQQWETFGSVALSCIGMGIFGTAVYTGQRGLNMPRYYQMKHLQNKWDNTGMDLFSGDEWAQMKEKIDNTPNENAGQLLASIVRDQKLTEEQARAAFNYARCMLTLRGMNIGTMKAAQLGLTDDKTIEQDQSYVEGRETSDEDKHDVQIEYEDKTKELADRLGISEQQLANMSDEELESLTGNDDKLDNVIYDYQNSHAKYQGVIDNADDNIDMAAQQAARQADMVTDKSRGTVRNATIKATKGREDYGVYIVSGNIATNEDGSINVSESDNMILYYDPQTGKIEHADASRFAAIGEEVNAEEAKNQAIADAKEKAIRKEAGIIDGTVGEGSSFTITDADGNEHTYEVLADNGDGTAMITLDGNVQDAPASLEDLQKLKDAEDAKKLEAAKLEREQHEKKRELQREKDNAPVEDNLDYSEVINNDGKIEIADVMNENGTSMFPDAQEVFFIQNQGNRAKVMVLDNDGNLKAKMVKKSAVISLGTMSVDEYKEERQQMLKESGKGSETSSVEEDRGEKENLQPIGKGTFGNIYNQFKGKVKEAFNFLISHKSGDLLGVFHRDDVGDIDLVWGNDKMGLAHIIGKHIGKGKDFENIDDAINMIDEVINKGRIFQESKNRYTLMLNGFAVGIRKDFDGKKKNWVVTAVDFNRTQEEKGIATNPTSTSHGTKESESTAALNDSQGKGTSNESNKQENSEKITLEDGTEVPMKEDGNPDFSQLTAKQTAELYDTQFGEDAEQIISDNVSKSKKALDNAANRKVTGSSFAEQKASKDAKDKAIAEAQEKYDSAKAVADAYNERQLAKEEDTPEGRQNLIDKARRKFNRMKSSVKDNAQAVAQLYNDTVGSLLHRLYDGTGIDVFDDTANTVEEYVSSHIAPYSLSYDGTETSKGVKQETGLSRTDFAKTGFLAKEGKGKTIDKLAHDLWQERPENLQDITDQDVRNAIIDIITSGETAFGLRNYIQDMRIAQAERVLEGQKRLADDLAYAEERKAKEEEQQPTENTDNDMEGNSETSDDTDTAPSDDAAEDNTSEMPFDAPSADDAPFSAKDETEEQTPEERQAFVEKNRVNDIKLVDDVIGKKLRKSLERIAKMMGAKIQWQRTDMKGNGWYNSETNTIYLTLDSSITEGVQFIFGHEMTHEIKMKSPAMYDELKNLVKNMYGEDLYEGMTDDNEQRYRDAGLAGYDRSYYEEETVADAIGEMINDMNLAHSLALKMSHPLLAQVHNVLLKVKTAFFGTEYSDAARNAIRTIEQVYVRTANGTFESSESEETNGEKLSAKKRRALETASLGINPRSLTAISSADGAKILQNIDNLILKYKNSSTQPKTFVGEMADALDVDMKDKSSKYANFECKNGNVVTIRISDHNATSSNLDINGQDNAISIVVTNKSNVGITNDGNAHIVEYYYNAIKLRKAEGKPLADIVSAIKQALYSGEFKDPTGLAERQEVNVSPNTEMFSVRDANERFNSEIENFKKKTHKGLMHLGAPSPVLKACGVDVDEITLSPKVLNRKLNQHSLTSDDVKDLVNSIQKPILVYKHGLSKPNMVVITDTEIRGNKLSIALELDAEGNVVEMNNVSSIHDKNAEEEVKRLLDFSPEQFKDAVKWCEKEKALDWLSSAHLFSHMQAETNQGLSLAKILNDFKNPNISEENLQDNDEKVSYSLRQKPEPKKKGIGYKVFVLGKDGKLYPPMVANPNGAATPVGVWLDADAAPIAGESKTGRPQVKQGGKGTQGGSGKLAYRPGWHLGVIPYALQFNRKDADGNKTLFPKNFVFAEVEYAADKDYQGEAHAEGINANGKYQHSLAGLKHLPTDGYYMYRTNPNPETDPWVITGAMKVNRLLTRAEQAELVRKAGREPQKIQDEDTVTDEVVNNINQEIANAPKFSLRVYHGSGADFTEFDFDHMGEGAGDQVFGWGGYVTSSKEIGKSYANLNDAKNLYEVNIPNDNGSNYLDWYAEAKPKLKEKIREYIEKETDPELKALPIYKEAEQRFHDEEGDDKSFDKEMINDAIEEFDRSKTVGDYYEALCMRSAPKFASKFLSSLGYTGFKYPAGTIMGGTKEGDMNYVIFKPEDMQIAEHEKFSLKRDKDDATEFHNIIDKMFEDDFDKSKHLRERYDLGKTPTWMKNVGIKGDGFSLSFKSIKVHKGKDVDHDLTKEEWHELPKAIKEPFAITRYQGANDRFRLYVNINHNGKPVAVGIDVKRVNQGKGKPQLDVNSIKTVFAHHGEIGGTEVLVAYDEKITPQQQALLRGLNFHEYPTIQELSAANIDKSSETSKESGEKFSLRLKNAINETDTEPTDAQKKSGNYKKGHVKFGGYDYTIENPKGSYRSGVDENGKEWEQKMHDTYGYIRGKFGKDGDHLDMFINDKADLDSWNGTVYIVDQVNKDGSFDEHKVMYGYDSLNAAKEAYLSNYEKGWTGLGNISAVEKADFDKWLDRSNRKLKPFADYTSITSKSDTYNVPNNFEEFLEHPVVRFSIRNESERAAAEDAYNYAQENRPDKYSQYAIVNMDRPGAMPEYMEKKKAADNWRRYYNKMEWGNYKLFDLNKPFEDNVKNLVGKFPNTFRKENDTTLSRINELTADYNNRKAEYAAMSKDIQEKMGEMLKTNPSSVDVVKQIQQTQEYKDMISKYQELMGIRKQLNELKNGKVADDGRYSLKEVNDDFNKRLHELVKNPNQKDKILRLGRSSSFLKDGGIVDAEIELDFDKLMRKSKQGYVHEHPFNPSDVKNLPMAIARPISVFYNTNGRNDGHVILTELKKEDKNFIVAVQTENQKRKGGIVLSVNKITTLFPKDAKGVINWFNQGKATNIDKEKTLHFIEALQNHYGTTIKSEELLSAANIVRKFESSKENGEKYSLKEVNDRFNEQLDKFTIENADKFVFDLGRPSTKLKTAGVTDKPIRLNGSKLAKKIRKHGFEPIELKNLPLAMENPIAVFNNLGREGNRSVLTELKTANGNFLVTIDLGKGTEADFDIVSSVFGKNGKGVVYWINHNMMKYVDKEKALNYLHLSAPIAEASDNSELLSAANIVRNFENPKENREKYSLKEVNDRFNERLSELIENPNQKDRVLHLGYSSQFLKDGGIADAEIEMDFDKFVRKSNERYKNNHPFSANDIKDLPTAIANPIAIFNSTVKNNHIVLTELKHDGKNFIVAIRATEQKRKNNVILEVNQITSLYPKGERGIIHWINTNRLSNVDKEKALHFIEALQPHAGTTTSEELSSAANVVRKFESSKENGEKYSLKEVNDRFNEQLKGLTRENADKEILSVGNPSSVLKSVGIPDRDIRLYGNKILKKAKVHSYSPTDLKDLPNAMQRPIAIFDGSYKGSYSIFTELQLNGENALASIDINKGEVQDINLITSVYGKRGDSVLSWINSGKMLYTDKKRTLDYISSSAPIADATHNREFSSAANIVRNFENPKENGEKYSLKNEDRKQAQLDIILKTNPMLDDYHTGIRKVEDIKTLEESVEEARNEAEKYDYDEWSAYPDITNDMLQDALETGEITIYSSKAIKNGVFVTPSYMQASDYAGGGKVYEKTVPLTDVAWINTDEGQYAKVDGEKYSLKSNVDNQGNPLNDDGTLKLDKIKSVDDLTDRNFTNATRNVQLPPIPQNVDAAIGANGKPIIIKKNIFEKNWNAHKFTPAESRKVLNDALYNTDLIGRSQPTKKPNHWVAIKLNEKSPITVLEVNDNKDNVEVVGWYTLDERNLGRIKRQAERNGGELIMLSPNDKVESLSTPPLNSAANVDNSSESTKNNKEKYSLIGKKGAANLDQAEEVSTRLDNLNVARQMEEAKKDAKAIKMATGWERGADGKWRYETGDVSLWNGLRLVKKGTEERATLGEMLEDGREKDELLAAYPQLKEMPLVFKDMGYREVGHYNNVQNEIVLNSYLLTDDNGVFTENASNVLDHEIQHVIQHIEGFAQGGNEITVKKDIQNRVNYLSQEIRRLKAEGKYDEAKELIKKNKATYNASVSESNDFKNYQSLAGEVEARNVQSRMGMSPEERRKSLAEETEDVARKDQIFLYGDDMRYSLKGVNNQSLFDAIHTLYSKGKTFASKLFNMKYFDVVETPGFMKRLGLSGDKFTVRYGVLSRHFGKDGSHDFTESEWNLLPEALKHPFAIAKLSDKKNAYRIYTSLKTEKGEYVVVGADVKNAGRNVEVNSIATIFGRRNNANLPINEELLYTSKEITPEQMALLSQPNSDQYPSNQELSAANVDNSPESTKNNQEKYSLIGKKGAANLDHEEEVSTRLDNLNVARQMEDAKKDAKAIKMATGWERGADGKWRYEIPDAKLSDMTDIDGKGTMVKRDAEDMLWTSGKLGDKVDAPELFKAYPGLRNVRLETDAITNDMPSRGSFNAKTNTIEIHASELKYLNSVLNHEIQHVIQHIEGFAQGGNEITVKKDIQNRVNYLSQEIRRLKAEGKYDEAKELIKKNKATYNASVSESNDFKNYQSLAGEVEARNVQSRMGMSPEERRKSLAEETEDVARKDQIFLYGDDMRYSLKGVNNQSLFDAIHTLYSKGKTFAENIYKRKFFDVANTPDFMKRLGLTGNKFTIRYGVISRHFGKDNQHDFTEEEWKQIPQALSNPILITEYYQDDQQKRQKGYRLYTPLKLADGSYVVVSAEVKNAGRNLEINAINTIFGRNAISDIHDRIVYQNPKITPEQMALLGENNPRQYPSNQELSAANVDNSSESTKNNEEKFSLKDSKADRIQKLRESKPVVITGNEYKGKYELNRESAQRYLLDKLRGDYVIKDTGEKVSLSKKGAKKVTAHSMSNEAHLKSIAIIPKLIENSIFIDEQPAYKKNAQFDSYRYYVVGLKLGGVDYTARLTIGVKNGKSYYDHYLTKIEKGNLIDLINQSDSQKQSFKPTEGAPNTSDALSGGKDTKLISILQTNKENNEEKYSLRVDRYREELNQWKKDNNLPKDAEKPQLPIREPNESAADFLKRVKEYRQQAALWATAPTYEQHLLTSDTAQGQFNLEMQRKAVLTRMVLQDSMLAIRKAQEAIMKEVGVDKLSFAEDAYTAENRSHGKGKNEFEEYNDEFLQPLRKAYNDLMHRLGKSYDNVKVYMIAKHGLERNAHIAFKKALDEDYEKNEERMDAYNNYKADIDRLNNDADFEAGRIDFATWKQNDVNIRTKYAPSYSKYRFDEDGNTLDYSGLTALFDADDFESAAADLVKDVEDNNEYYTDELWYATNLATRKILTDSYKAGMMTEDVYNFVRGMYSNYIPLRGWGDTNADQVWNYVGGGKGAFNQTLKEAKGRKSLADDPIAYIENMAESGILMNNRNWVKQHLLLLAENHPTSLLNVSKAWYIKTTDAQGNEEWIPASPQITSGMTSKQVDAALEAFENKMEQMAQKGDATQKRAHLEISYPQTNGEEREHEVRVMKNGEEYVIYINGDPQLAQAMNNIRARKVREGLDNSLSQRVIARTGRYMAAAYTSLSPLFIPSNYMRDLTMTLASTAIREDARYNYLLRRNMLRNWNTFALVLRYQNGTLREKVRNGNASRVEEMFYDFMMNGGETGFVTSVDVEELKKKFRNELKDMNRMAANPKKVGHIIMESIETLNRAIEDSNRFMIYMTSIEYGRSIDEAVNNAKDVTLNFNRKGTGEHGWQTIRNLYLFINPAIQSLQTLGALAKHHPFKFTAVTTAWMASGVLVPLVNNLLMSMFGGDDDKDKYWQFTKWDRRNNFIMWVPFTHEFVKIPLAQEFRGFYGIGDMIASKLWGGEKTEESWGDYALDLMGQIVDMLPLDPTGYDGNVAVSLMPNPIRPFFELAFNVDFTGKPLFKDSEYNKYDPNFTKAYVGTPEWLVRISRMVNSIGNDYPDVQQNWIDRAVNSRFNLNNPAVVDHVLSSYLGGAYTMGSQTLGVMTKALNGDEIKMADIPLASKFVSNPDDRPVSKKQGDEFWNVKERHDRAANTLSKLKKKAKVDGDYSTLDIFFGSDEYRQYKEDDKVVKKYEEDRKKEKAQETGEEYKAHKTTGEDVYKLHTTPKDDFEDMKMKQLYEKLNSFKIRYEAIDGISREKGDAYYRANKAAIEAVEDVAYDRKTISDIKKGFLYDGKAYYDADGMKDIRELRRRILDILEKANKAVLNRNK